MLSTNGDYVCYWSYEPQVSVGAVADRVLFVAAALLILFLFAKCVHKLIIARGRLTDHVYCPRCGFDQTFSNAPVCTECGFSPGRWSSTLKRAQAMTAFTVIVIGLIGVTSLFPATSRQYTSQTAWIAGSVFGKFFGPHDVTKISLLDTKSLGNGRVVGLVPARAQVLGAAARQILVVHDDFIMAWLVSPSGEMKSIRLPGVSLDDARFLDGRWIIRSPPILGPDFDPNAIPPDTWHMLSSAEPRLVETTRPADSNIKDSWTIETARDRYGWDIRVVPGEGQGDPIIVARDFDGACSSNGRIVVRHGDRLQSFVVMPQ